MILPDQYKHLKGTYIGDQMEGIIIRTWIGWAFKAIIGIAVVIACIKYALS